MTMKIPEALDVLESLMSDRAASPDEEKGMKADVDEARKQWTDTHLSSKELATVLAALRYWQMDVLEIEGAKKGEAHFEEVEPLTTKEVDALCERLNCA